MTELSELKEHANRLSQSPSKDQQELSQDYGDFFTVGQHYGSSRKQELRLVDNLAGGQWWVYRNGLWGMADKALRSIQRDFANRQPKLQLDLAELGFRSAAEAIHPHINKNREISWRRDGWQQIVDGMASIVSVTLPPSPKPYIIGVPNGALDLRSGKLLPDSPDHNLRGKTGGNWLGQESLPDCIQTVRQSLHRTFSPDTLNRFIELAAIGLSGHAQAINGCAAIAVWGNKRSGKGQAVNWLIQSLGHYAQGVESRWIAHKSGSGEIDSVSTDLLERDGRIVVLTELSGDTGISAAQMLSKTGAEFRSSRRPYGQTIEGVLRTQLWITCVRPPAYRESDTPGLRERLSILETLGNTWQAGNTGSQGDIIDALTTCILARLIQLQPALSSGTYIPPATPVDLMARMFQELDGLAAWIKAMESSVQDHISAQELLREGKAEVDWNLTATSLGWALRDRGWRRRRKGGKAFWSPPS